MHGPWLNLVIIPFNDPNFFFYHDVSLYIMSARLSLANKWSPPFVNVVDCVNICVTMAHGPFLKFYLQQKNVLPYTK